MAEIRTTSNRPVGAVGLTDTMETGRALIEGKLISRLPTAGNLTDGTAELAGKTFD